MIDHQFIVVVDSSEGPIYYGPWSTYDEADDEARNAKFIGPWHIDKIWMNFND